MGKATCFVCGKEKDATGKAAVPACVDKKTTLLNAHEKCFCVHQIYRVLNTDGCVVCLAQPLKLLQNIRMVPTLLITYREDKCEKGDWVLDWKADIPKYVKADLVDSVQLALTEVSMDYVCRTRALVELIWAHRSTSRCAAS